MIVWTMSVLIETYWNVKTLNEVLIEDDLSY